MKSIFITMILIIVSDSIIQAQKSLFSENEIDSLEYYYLPLYSNDSIQVKDMGNFEFMNVYFFNGECSLCLGKMKAVDTFFLVNSKNSIKTLFIVETSDTISFNFHRDKYNIKAPIVWDNYHRIRGKAITDENNICFLINRLGNIVLLGDFVNDSELKNKYLKMTTPK